MVLIQYEFFFILKVNFSEIGFFCFFYKSIKKVIQAFNLNASLLTLVQQTSMKCKYNNLIKYELSCPYIKCFISILFIVEWLLCSCINSPKSHKQSYLLNEKKKEGIFYALDAHRIELRM